jgi:hypothetical protein
MDPRFSRTEFIETLIRGGMLTGLAGFGAAALHGTKTVEECINENYCASCWAYSGCGLPEKKEIVP